MIKKLLRLLALITYFFKDEDNLFLYLLELKARDSLKDCYNLNISKTEDLEDLIFHIRSYVSIPEALAEIKYKEFKNVSLKEIIKRCKDKSISKEEIDKYSEYLTEIEEYRAVERDSIFEHAKILSFGFSATFN